MFKIIILIVFLIILYAAFKNEKKGVRYTILAYFGLLSVIFMSGIANIAFKYHLYNGPVLEGGFESLSEWVGVFSYFYIIPFFLIMAYKIFRLTQKRFHRNWLIIIMFIVLMAVLAGICFLAFFLFTLIFYGFAP
ncbi:hypothetical protein [Neobacillus mesonae]|uniref:hypothetical protein n=1 Tax=Neobacillus mesonae TaxID=1193713 RepID=UPI00203F0ECD|nr:hypothetical protein [Neobacillus mesonae]MCM3571407.1 hypothetical protein [Neobacillus mesonae]